MIAPRESEFCRLARMKNGFKQNQVARAISMTPQFYGRVEKGEVHLPTTKVKPFAAFTKTKWRDLVSAKAADFVDELIKEIEQT